jgi:NAD+ kinase
MSLRFYLHADTTNPKALEAVQLLTRKYAQSIVPIDEADTIIALGGDGTTLDALRLGLKHGKKVYGMNLGHVGAYQNKFSVQNLPERIVNTTEVKLNPLTAKAITLDEKRVQAEAWNEIYVRSGDNPQQARLVGYVDGWKLPFSVSGDGYLLATPLGSHAYNLAAGGHKLHFREQLLASTAIAASRGVCDILPNHARIHLEVKDPVKRCVSLVADNRLIGKIKSCDIFQDFSKSVSLLWDPEKIRQVEVKGRQTIKERPRLVLRALQNNGYYHDQYLRV